MTNLRAFRWTAIAEATSWLLLIIATVVKYAADQPWGVHVMGPIHGLLFLGYVGLALGIRAQARWSGRDLLTVLVESVLPFGGYLAARRPELADDAPARSG